MTAFNRLEEIVRNCDTAYLDEHWAWDADPHQIATELLAAHQAEVRREDAARLLDQRRTHISRAIFCDGITHAAGLLNRWADENPAAATPEGIAADGQAYDGELAMLRGLVRTLRVVVREDVDVAEVRRLLHEHATDEAAAREEATAEAAPATPTDTNRRARLLHEMAYDGGRWKSGDVVRWYETQGLTGLGVRAARHDLAILRDSGAITQHDEKGVRFYTLNSQKGSRS